VGPRGPCRKGNILLFFKRGQLEGQVEKVRRAEGKSGPAEIVPSKQVTNLKRHSDEGGRCTLSLGILWYISDRREIVKKNISGVDVKKSHGHAGAKGEKLS